MRFTLFADFGLTYLLVAQMTATVLTIEMTGLSNNCYASDDPCIQALMSSSPAQAAALSAKREGQAKPETFERLDWALEGRDERKNNDAQMKPEWAGDAAQIAGDWNSEAAPRFLAGALIETNPKTKATLLECHVRRSAQGRADKIVADLNKKIAEKARQEDGLRAPGLAGYDPTVISAASK